MSYHRVIPRDFFNEANLLKCYGQLWLALDHLHGDAQLVYVPDEEHDRPEGFDITQDPADGSLSLGNVQFWVRGRIIPLMRPCNSRDPFSLYAYPSDEPISVFTAQGELTPELLTCLREATRG